MLLYSCSKPSPWTTEQIDSEQTQYSFVRLSYHSPDPVNGIDLEFIQNHDQIQAYLIVHSTPIAPLKESPHHIAVSIHNLNESFRCTAYRFQGGQKFLLSAENTEKMIALLKSKEEITILLNGYRAILHPEDFEKKLETFLHPFFLRNPFQFSL